MFMDLPQKSNYRDPRPLISCVSCVSCNSWIAVYVAKERSTNCTKHTKYHEISEAAMPPHSALRLCLTDKHFYDFMRQCLCPKEAQPNQPWRAGRDEVGTRAANLRTAK